MHRWFEYIFAYHNSIHKMSARRSVSSGSCVKYSRILLRVGDRAHKRDEGNRKTSRPELSPLYSVLAIADLHRRKLAPMALVAQKPTGSDQRGPNKGEDDTAKLPYDRQ